MALICPYCQHAITLKNVKPGRYGPKCPKCARAFHLAVPDNPDAPPTIRALAAPEATAAMTGVQPPESACPDVTAAYSAGGEEPAAALPAESDAAVGSTLAPDEAPRPPTKSAKAGGPKVVLATLGGYQMLKLLGRGGMGAVYLARQTSLDRLVAVKVMLPKAAANPAFVARFTREAYAAAQMVHHNIVQIYDIGSAKNTQYFSMEYVKGESPKGLVRREGKLDPEHAVGYVLQAARGLKYGHDLGMVHRDVKPDNLMLNDQGIVKVADMGLVKLSGEARPTTAPAGENDAALAAPAELTWAGVVMGTASYMSPEQTTDSSAVGTAADVYSLGCTLYVLLTGKPPFEGKTVMEVLTKHATAPVVRPEAVVKRVPKAAVRRAGEDAGQDAGGALRRHGPSHWGAGEILGRSADGAVHAARGTRRLAGKKHQAVQRGADSETPFVGRARVLRRRRDAAGRTKPRETWRWPGSCSCGRSGPVGRGLTTMNERV